NELLSMRKANSMALVALLKYLNPDKKNASLSCSGRQTIKAEYSEKVCHVVCKIPINGVTIIDAPVVAKQTPKMNANLSAESKADSGVKIVSSKSSLLTKQADYEETINELADVLIQSAPQCIDSFEKFSVFIKAITDFEEQIKKRYAQMKTAIEQERELLRLEKSELLEFLAQSQDKPMKRLKGLEKCSQEVEKIGNLTNALLRSAPQCAICSEEIDDFYEALADYEEKIEKQYDFLKESIEQDSELLSTDKSKLLTVLTQSQNEPMKRLKALAKCAQELETLKDFESEPEYAEYLLSNPFYRNHGGVEIYRSSTGYGLISLGKSVISQNSNDKPAILLRKAQRVAELRAKAELAGEIEGKNVKVKETYTETVETKSTGTKEEQVLSIDDYSRIIHESTSAFLQNVHPVATWRSADGKIVYVVLGMFREKK
ncbi:MAG: hypothetical protein IKU45_00990, partial [Clostridia bacterium]|nr:hypothetical protein [Clostridia bacterium]